VVIVRGGGARLDLVAFDELGLCKEIANCPLPVLLGVGHEIDETVADLVAHESLKTPTAVAAFIVQHNLHFESELIDIQQWIQQTIGDRVTGEEQLLQSFEQQVVLHSEKLMAQHSRMLDYFLEEFPRLVTRVVRDEEKRLVQQEALVGLLDPQAVLARGYSMTLRDGRVVRSVKEVKEGDVLRTVFGDGEVGSRVISSQNKLSVKK